MTKKKKKKIRDLQRAVQHFDFEEFLVHNGVQVEQKQTQIAGICPLCNWKRQSFYVNPDNGLWICHYCGEAGGPVRLIQSVLGCSFTVAMDRLFDNFTVFIDDPDAEQEYKEIEVATIEFPEGFTPLFQNDAIAARLYRRYCRKRGIDEDMLAAYNIGYTAVGYYTGRVVVPVYHLGGLVNFVARAITENHPKGKVLTPPGNEQYKYLFNLDNIWGAEEVIAMEGVFDALTLPEKAIATFGKKITDEQAALLRRSGVKTVTFCYDDDAIKEATNFAQKYWMTFKTYIIHMPPGLDPSKAGREMMLQLAEKREPVKPNSLHLE